MVLLLFACMGSANEGAVAVSCSFLLMSGEPPPSDVKSAARSLIRQLRDSNFSTWYSHLGPYQALKLQEEHARQIAPVVGPGAADSVDSAAAGAAAASERGEAAEASIVGYIRNDDGSVQRLKIPEKDVRLKAILYLQRFQRYLEDLPSRQVKPPKSKAIGMPKGTTVGDALGEVRRRCCTNVGVVRSSLSFT